MDVFVCLFVCMFVCLFVCFNSSACFKSIGPFNLTSDKYIKVVCFLLEIVAINNDVCKRKYAILQYGHTIIGLIKLNFEVITYENNSITYVKSRAASFWSCMLWEKSSKVYQLEVGEWIKICEQLS